MGIFPSVWRFGNFWNELCQPIMSVSIWTSELPRTELFGHHNFWIHGLVPRLPLSKIELSPTVAKYELSIRFYNRQTSEQRWPQSLLLLLPPSFRGSKSAFSSLHSHGKECLQTPLTCFWATIRCAKNIWLEEKPIEIIISIVGEVI